MFAHTLRSALPILTFALAACGSPDPEDEHMLDALEEIEGDVAPIESEEQGLVRKTTSAFIIMNYWCDADGCRCYGESDCEYMFDNGCASYPNAQCNGATGIALRCYCLR